MAKEIFQFEDLIYDVDGLKELVKTSGLRYGPHNVPINENMKHGISGYVEPDLTVIKQMTAQRRDEPIIVVELGNGMVRIVDGYHRIQRRVEDGLHDVWQYTVPYKVALPYIDKIA